MSDSRAWFSWKSAFTSENEAEREANRLRRDKGWAARVVKNPKPKSKRANQNTWSVEIYK